LPELSSKEGNYGEKSHGLKIYRIYLQTRVDRLLDLPLAAILYTRVTEGFMKQAVSYARVSSERQRERHTIASQLSLLSDLIRQKVNR